MEIWNQVLRMSFYSMEKAALKIKFKLLLIHTTIHSDIKLVTCC